MNYGDVQIFYDRIGQMTREETIKFLILRSIGNFLVLFAIFGVFATFGPALYYEFQYRVAKARGVHYQIQNSEVKSQNSTEKSTPVTQSSSFVNILTGPTQQILTAPDPNFSILIPKIGASAIVFPNVDASNPGEYLPKLLEGVAHAKGSVFPGISGNTYLFAHSTDNFWDVGRYNAVFYLLKDLSPGDDIVVFFENRRFNYKVSEIKILDDTEVSYLVNAQSSGVQKLILQTCWPPGTTWKRLIVIAKPL